MKLDEYGNMEIMEVEDSSDAQGMNGTQNSSSTATEQLEEAIKGLNNLQTQIASYVTAEEWSDRKGIQLEFGQSVKSVHEGFWKESKTGNNPPSVTLGTSVAVIQTLLGDTQDLCSRMVDNKKEYSTKLDGELGKCQEEMDSLKKELAYATRCVSDLEVNMMIHGSATESDSEAHAAERELEVTVYRLREENGRLHLQVKALQQELFLAKTARPSGANHYQGIADKNRLKHNFYYEFLNLV